MENPITFLAAFPSSVLYIQYTNSVKLPVLIQKMFFPDPPSSKFSSAGLWPFRISLITIYPEQKDLFKYGDGNKFQVILNK